ncbi:methenyltetrahydrofolate cyclohydrolase / 5,10-methylenetetrahydrofolate dehydrogenase (NADP+) [Desulforamulus reducens MI-1]|uniref:Bifunctional protein FolD n=1 Tax=Desulforamulus reducens (strain ATCC BAA-1160 / DSM 100696 / MI-1) TaxID=349161 RepID=FOLD_DESRM|nr:tetrahydrofolate dehydrogenase/cyclohydrolase catalytic domain-containing protein [Desulforamulus reducens]A4J3F5.1 RecName: Full=Bifunctional protein FolD; Includes: RecName: Full=Methylenetetrahydrofolate dehydrogenase; Includes: RecName: Full=Methenyltetrahydrofolate cyclohydrolase [Desulforamulus reducens MI-1]ABO49608.1 methenyltetrahydrofolate cyclohydrolase / 5,10-methylenetetrahydrofolate dehydrogenase (NADP+) [Desulforamulus reducens MI-1]
MTKILDGKKIASILREELKQDIITLKERGIEPKLAVVLVGEDPASVAYAKFLQKVSENAGVLFELHQLSKSTAEEEIICKIEDLNQIQAVHGILMMMPLPPHVNKQHIMEHISPLKDVDGLHPFNRGHLISGGICLHPATPTSCLEILKRSGITLAGKHIVVVGRGETVGKPLVFMALAENATVTVCHSRTVDLGKFTKQADIIISAVGKPGLITADMIKPGAVVVDAGIHEEAGNIIGDVDYEQVKEIAEAITPVPGGVGSLTTVLMLKNVLKGIQLQIGTQE